MSLRSRLANSWELFQRSLQVIRAQPRLVLFPIVTAGCALLLVAFFLTPVVLLLIGVHGGGGDWEADVRRFAPAFYAYGALAYVVAMFVGTFVNVAFYNEIFRALSGEKVSLRSGLRYARTKLRSILMWSLLASTVGLLIRWIEDRLGFVGKFVMSLVGAAWSVASVFAIPVIIRREDSNPLAVLRDSASTLKKTWGESLAGYIGIQLGGLAFLAFVAFSAVVGIGFGVLLGWVEVLYIVIPLALFALVAFGVVLGVAGDVYRCALYVYATEGVVPGPYTPELMNAGWKVKKK